MLVKWSCVGKGAFVRVKVVFSAVMREKADLCRGKRFCIGTGGFQQSCLGNGGFLSGKADFSGLVRLKADLCG